MSILNLKMDSWTYARLSEPFQLHEVRFRTAFSPPRGGGEAQVLAYIDARSVVERLNQVVGTENWTDSYQPISFRETAEQEVNENGLFVTKYNKGNAYTTVTFPRYHEGVIATLTVLGVTKSDAGAVTYSDPLKGAVSDAIKRVGVKFGIGSYMYDLKGLTARVDSKGRVVEPPQLPDYALPVERSSPKDAILALIEKVKTSNLPSEDRLLAEKIIDEVMVMGYYNPNAPLVVVRAVYEQLSRLLGGLNGA